MTKIDVKKIVLCSFLMVCLAGTACAMTNSDAGDSKNVDMVGDAKGSAAGSASSNTYVSKVNAAKKGEGTVSFFVFVETIRERIPFTFEILNGDTFYASLKKIIAGLKEKNLDDDNIVKVVARRIKQKNIDVNKIFCRHYKLYENPNYQWDCHGRIEISTITPLHKAAIDGDVLVTRILLRAGENRIEGKDDCGYTALYHAFLNGRVGVAEMLLDAKACVTDCYDAITFYDRSPLKPQGDKRRDFTLLHIAALFGDVKLVELLSKKDEKQVRSLAQQKDRLGKRPIDWAKEFCENEAYSSQKEQREGCLRVIKMLQEYTEK